MDPNTDKVKGMTRPEDMTMEQLHKDVDHLRKVVIKNPDSESAAGLMAVLEVIDESMDKIDKSEAAQKARVVEDVEVGAAFKDENKASKAQQSKGRALKDTVEEQGTLLDETGKTAELSADDGTESDVSTSEYEQDWGALIALRKRRAQLYGVPKGNLK